MTLVSKGEQLLCEIKQRKLIIRKLWILKNSDAGRLCLLQDMRNLKMSKRKLKLKVTSAKKNYNF